jgi:hypothetical protein
MSGVQQPSFETAYAAPAADTTGAPPPPGRVSVLDALRFVTSQPGWTMNVVYALLALFVPVVGPLVFIGWQAEMMQRLVRRHPHPVPPLDVDDALHYLMRGLAPFVVTLAFQVPFFLFLYFLVFGMAGGAAIVLDATGSEGAAWGVGIGFALVGFVVWAYGSALVNAAHTRAELVEDFGEGFAMGKIFRYANKTWLKHLGVMLVFGLIGLGMGMLGLLVFFVGVYFVAAFLQLAAVHLRWQMYEWAVARGAEPITPKAPQWLPSEAKRAQAEAWARQWAEQQQGAKYGNLEGGR